MMIPPIVESNASPLNEEKCIAEPVSFGYTARSSAKYNRPSDDKYRVQCEGYYLMDRIYRNELVVIRSK